MLIRLLGLSDEQSMGVYESGGKGKKKKKKVVGFGD